MATSIAGLIAPHLPYLRRFARALTGSQKQGDAYVVATLEALVADNGIFNRDLTPKSALYSSFLKVWRAVPLNDTTEAATSGASGLAERRIGSLTPRARQAFLLAALEDFPPREIAAVMGCDEPEACGLIDRAGREIAGQIAAKVLIIEDEPLIALDIESLVTDIGHEVVGIAATRAEAVSLAGRTEPGIVLADIQLADGSSGIDAVNDILKTSTMPVIFITAYPERLLTGEREEPTFLITKPFRPDMVKAVMSQALFFGVDGAPSATAG